MSKLSHRACFWSIKVNVLRLPALLATVDYRYPRTCGKSAMKLHPKGTYADLRKYIGTVEKPLCTSPTTRNFGQIVQIGTRKLLQLSGYN